MTDAAAFQGTFADFRTVKGRKVCQFVIEVPIETANAALTALGGVPDPSKEIWVGVARLDRDAASEAPRPSNEVFREKRRFRELPGPTQAALACENELFWEFLGHGQELIPVHKDGALLLLKERLNVESRSELTPGSEALAKWNELYGQFEVWLKYERNQG